MGFGLTPRQDSCQTEATELSSCLTERWPGSPPTGSSERRRLSVVNLLVFFQSHLTIASYGASLPCSLSKLLLYIHCHAYLWFPLLSSVGILKTLASVSTSSSFSLGQHPWFSPLWKAVIFLLFSLLWVCHKDYVLIRGLSLAQAWGLHPWAQ